MTSQSITDVLASIGEAKRALDAEPGYLRHIRELEQKLIIDGQTIAHREQRIHELKQQHDEAIAKLRSVEAERDDAGFRALEEADKVSALSTLLRSFIGDALRVLAAVEGKPEPVIVTVDDARELKELRQEREQVMADVNRLRDIVEDKDIHIQDLEDKMATMFRPEPMVLARPLPGESTSQSEPTASSIGETTSSLGSGDGPFPDASTNPSVSGAVESGNAVPAERSSGEDPFVSLTAPPSQTALGTGTVPVPSGEMTVLSEAPVAMEESAKPDPFASRGNTPQVPVSSSGADSDGNAVSSDLPEPSRAAHYS